MDEQCAVKAEIVLIAAVTKSKRARCIFVAKSMLQQLKRYVLGLCQKNIDSYLFSKQKNSHFTANKVTQDLQLLCQRAGLVSTKSNSVRRNWLTKFSAKGVGVRVLAEMAGHASI